MTGSLPDLAETRSGMIFVMISALLWGTVGVTTRAIYSVSDANPLSIGFFRLSIGSAGLLIAGFRILKWKLFQVPASDLALMAGTGLLMAFYQVSFFTSIQTLGAAAATLITLCTAPAIVAILSTLVTKEKITLRIYAAMGCALLGTTLLMRVGPADKQFSASLAGVGWALASAFGYSAMVVISRQLAGKYHPVQPFAIGLSIGAVLLLIIAGLTGLVSSFSPIGWGLLIYLGLFPTALAFGIFLAGMEHTSATAASIITLLEPLTSAVLAAVLFKEHLGAMGAFGAALLLGAILLLWQKQEW